MATIVYLDQKCWINLAKIYYGDPSDLEQELLDIIMRASDNGTTIFPISLIHLSETCSISNPKWRKQLASLMVKISKSYILTPHWVEILELEIRNLILEKLGVPRIDIRNFFLGRGVVKLMGATPKVVSETIDPKYLEELNKQLLNTLNDPETLEYFLKYKRDKSLKQEQIKTVEEFEHIRKKLQGIKDNDLRRKAFLLQNFRATIMPKIARIAYELELPKEVLDNIFTPFDIDEFLDRLPTALCEFTLLFQRDQQIQRSINVNDINDVWSLTLAIPYSDIVVTEKMWASILTQAKLDKKCNTIILSSIKELSRFL